MKKRNKKYLFYNYVISYIGVVVIALSLVSSLEMWSAAERMREEENRIIQNRMYVVANDFEEQMATMRTIVLNVASRAEFRQDRFQKSKYLEFEMLNDLKQYNWMTDISDLFFLKYQGEENIFTSQGETSSFEVYCKNKIEQKELSNVRLAVETASQNADTPYVLVRTGESSMLMIFSLKKYATSSIGMDGVLCFVITEKSLEKRMEQMAGNFQGNVEIFCEDFPLIEQDDRENTDGDLILETVSENGKIRIVFRPETTGYFNWNHIYSPGKVVILVCIILILLAISLAEAWKRYVPIYKLMKKYNIQKDTIGDNELDQIDSMIASMIQREEKDGEALQKQYRLLREQVLCMIASEGYTPMLQSRMPMLNIRLDGAVFGKIICYFEDAAGVEHDSGLVLAVEELSDEGVNVYAFWASEIRMTVLVSAEEEYQIGDVEEALGSLFDVRGFQAEVRQQGNCRDLKQLHIISDKKREENTAFGVGVENRDGSQETTEPGNRRDISEDEGNDDFRIQSATAVRAMKYIDENYTRYDLSLDLVAGELQITSPYLCRLIKQQTGMNYKEYLTRLRMAEAKRLLQNKNAGIADVCQQIGYSNVSHFIKTFQKYEGITPAKYRDVR